MNHFLKRHPLAVTAVVTSLCALLLYWPILKFPLSFDDLLHIRLVKGLDYVSVWLPLAEANFYRPFMFIPLLLTRSLFGTYPAPFVYSLNLLFFLLNGLLFVWFTWRLWQRWPRSLTAGLLFGSYPFAYQAVAVFGNNIYLFLLGIILLALHTYLLALTGSRIWWLVTAVLFIIGLLSHELMVLFPLFAALTHWASQNKIQIGNWTWANKNWQALLDLKTVLRVSPFVSFLFISLLYFVLYQFLPVAGAPPAASNLLQPRLLYLLQSGVYPLAALANTVDALPTPSIILVSLLILSALSIWAARQPENRLALLLGWGWWGSTSLLLLLTLPTDYIVHGPRLIYLSSIGSSIIWAIVLDALFSWRRLGKVLATAVVILIVLFSGIFVRQRVTALANLGSPIALIKQVMAARPLPEGVLLVNFPAYSAPAQTIFPAGIEHVALMGSHLFAEEIVWENLNQVRPVLAVGLPELLSDPGYPYGSHVQTDLPLTAQDLPAAGAHVFLSEFTETGVVSIYTGQFKPAENEPTPVAYFGEYTLLAATAIFCKGSLATQLIWQLNGTPSPATSLFVQALADDGRVIAQEDGPPLSIRPDLLPLPQNWQIIDQRQLSPEPGTQASQLLIGVYDYQTGTRFPAQDANNTDLPANAYSLSPQPCPNS